MDVFPNWQHTLAGTEFPKSPQQMISQELLGAKCIIDFGRPINCKLAQLFHSLVDHSDRVRCPPFSQDRSIKSIVSFSKWWSTFGARQMKYRQLPGSHTSSHTYPPQFFTDRANLKQEKLWRLLPQDLCNKSLKCSKCPIKRGR